MSRRPGRRSRVVPFAGSSFSPTDIGGLVLWLDNSLITESGGRVTAWPDLSGAGNHFTQASPPIQPNYIASETDFPVAQPAVKFDVSNNYLSGPALQDIAWFAAVAVYPATTFADYSTLIAGTDLTQYILRGEISTASWRFSIPSCTHYRDGSATSVALTTANAPHLYEAIPASPVDFTSAVILGRDLAGARIWSDSVALVLMATAVPDAATRAALLAYCQGRGMIP